MKIEKEVVHFEANFTGLSDLTDLQKLYLQVLQGGKSLEAVVHHFLQQGWLVNFVELADLVEKLVTNKSLRNLNFYVYFDKMKPTSERSLWNKIVNLDFPESSMGSMRNYKELPFFRTLEPQLTDFLLSKATMHHVPPKSLICRQGETTRDLFVILKGTAGIYKPHQQSGKYLVATLSDNAVFGEGAFLLGHPRSADVISLSDCRILRIPCLPEIFDRYLKKDKAQGLQYRFWVQHALLNSPLLKEVPSDCFDALSYSGKFVQCPEGQVLFHEGEKGHSVYIVVQGSLVVNKNGQNINVLNQGGILGEIALLANQGLRSASVFAQRDSLLIEINQAEFYKLLAQNIFLGKYLQELAYSRLLKDEKRAG
ncbi:MAG TPA: cyclic nucleotide-binding domain-containing protein [Pseudobdellovibrionaceae bacterium]|jgi:CRP-like cAMP-binding protein